MKKGIIIYAVEDVEKNKRFIDMCVAGLSQKALLELVILENDFCGDIEEIANTDEISFAINRSRNAEVSKQLEKKCIRVFNNSRVTDICNDKWKTYQYARSKGIPVMDTELVTTANRVKEKNNEIMDLSYPRVIKSLAGHGGSEVFLVKNENEERQAAEAVKGDYIAQKLADAKGRDVRVYMLGADVVVAMCRSTEDGFKSNYSLGGSAKVYEVNEKEFEIVKCIAEDLQSDYVGIDFIYDGDRLVLNEIEDAVGARMVYANTDIPIVEKYVEYVARNI